MTNLTIVPCAVILTVAAADSQGAGMGVFVVNAALLAIAAWLFTRELRQQRRDFQNEAERARVESIKESRRWRHAFVNVVTACGLTKASEGILEKVDAELKRMEEAEDN